MFFKMIPTQTREDWEKARNQLAADFRIGGSTIADILGLGFNTPYALAQKLLHHTKTPSTERMEIGTALEPALLDLLSTRTGVKFHKPDCIYQSEEHPVAIASLDGISEDGQTIAEIKVISYESSKRGAWGEEGTDQIAFKYLCQVQWYMGVMGAKRALVGALIAGSEFKIYEVAFDADLFEVMIKRAEMFVENLKNGILPPVDGSENASVAIARQFPRSSGDLLPASEEDFSLADEIKVISEQIKELEAQKAERENLLKLKIGEAEGIAGVVTWKTQERSSLDTTLLKKEMPEVVGQYTKISSFRVLRFK